MSGANAATRAERSSTRYRFREPTIAGLHSARLDVSLLLASTYLLIAGGGRYALDRVLRKGGETAS